MENLEDVPSSYREVNEEVNDQPLNKVMRADLDDIGYSRVIVPSPVLHKVIVAIDILFRVPSQRRAKRLSRDHETNTVETNLSDHGILDVESRLSRPLSE